MNPYLELLAGIACAFAGGELFVHGIVGVSAWMRIPKAVAATSLAAFATSSPEVAVAVSAALAGQTPIALGDALGSNIVNVGLILGIALCLAPLAFDWREVRRDYFVALAAPLVIALILADGRFTRIEAAGCLVLFTLWLGFTIRHARNNRTEADENFTRRQGLLALVKIVFGLLFLMLAGRLIVAGAIEIGRIWQLDPFLVGATMVAFGTSAPELATVVIARLRGHDDIGIGTILGSNIFNCLLIVGIAGSIAPFEEPLAHVISSILFGLFTLAVLVPFRGRMLGRGRGIVLLLLYAGSILIAWLTQSGIGH